MKRFPRLLDIILVVLILMGMGAGANYAYRFTRQFVSSWQITNLGNQPGFTFHQSATPTPNHEPNPAQTQTPGEDPAPVTPPEEVWEGARRVTVLVMGLDYRDWETGEGAPRTDTMILLTIDPLSKTAGMLSIPRDLYVEIPGFEKPERINTAYRFGELYQLPGGGPELARKTVEKMIGVPVDYYAQLDFGAFERFIDEIDGVKLDIKEPIKIDPIGPKLPRVIPAGITVLPGDLALAYARARNTEGGDFDRAQRQQQVILAIRDRILDFNMAPSLILKAPQLYEELSGGVSTDMTLDQAIKLGRLAMQIKREDIHQGAIGTEQVVFITSPEGDQVLKPLPDKIRLLRDEVFATSLGSPIFSLSPEEQLKAEAANLGVYNGTYTSRLASRTAEYLNGLGAIVKEENIGDSPELHAYTIVIDHTGNPYTLRYLVKLFHLDPIRIHRDWNPDSPIDIEIHLGNDWVANNPLP